MEWNLKQFQTAIIAVFIISLLPAALLSQPLGELYDVGDTYTDYQHDGSAGRMIALENNGTVHFSWTGYLYPMEVLYNRYTTSGGVVFPYGVDVSDLVLSRSSNIAIFTTGRTIHVYQGEFLGQSICAVAIENSPMSANYLEYFPPADESLSNPILVVDSRRWIHILAFTERFNWSYGLYYNRSTDSGFSWLSDWVFVDSVRAIAADIAASSQGEVAIAWAHNLSAAFTNPLEKLNNDLYLVRSNNGSDWDFTSPVNVTNFSSGAHPKSDSLRLYDAFSMTYGSGNQLHIAYTCTGYWQETGHSMTCSGSEIYHYSDVSGVHYITGALASGSFPNVDRRTFDRPVIGYDAADADFFCVWNQYSDSADTSSQGVLNGEIYGAYFNPQYNQWSASINLTQTPTPGAEPGGCLSESFPSIALAVNDTLHISFLLDCDPAASGNFMSEIMYLKIPAEEFKAAVGVVNPPGQVLPRCSALLINYPNPCNSSTIISFALPQESDVELNIYDLKGRFIEEIFRGELVSGSHNFAWNAENISSGIYFLRLSYNQQTISRKIVILK